MALRAKFVMVWLLRDFREDVNFQGRVLPSAVRKTAQKVFFLI